MEISRIIELHYSFIGCRLHRGIHLSKRVNLHTYDPGTSLFHFKFFKKSNHLDCLLKCSGAPQTVVGVRESSGAGRGICILHSLQLRRER